MQNVVSCNRAYKQTLSKLLKISVIKLTQLTRTLHPPAGAVALVGVLSNADWHFIFTPALAGSIIIVLVTVISSNVVIGH